MNNLNFDQLFKKYDYHIVTEKDEVTNRVGCY